MGGGEPGEEGGVGLEHGLPVSSLYKASFCFVRSGVWEEENLARNVEGDWKMVLPVSPLYKATSCLVRSGVWEEENLARKVEGDWNMVYPCLLLIKQPPAWLGLACGRRRTWVGRWRGTGTWSTRVFSL